VPPTEYRASAFKYSVTSPVTSQFVINVLQACCDVIMKSERVSEWICKEAAVVSSKGFLQQEFCLLGSLRIKKNRVGDPLKHACKTFTGGLC
jgi:hypothetical protein